MTAEQMDIPEAADITKYNRKVTKNGSFWEKLRLKDENAAERIKDTADKTGVIGTIGALVLGIAVWSRSNSLVDFFIGLIIAAAGVFVTSVLVSVLYSYGDMINLSIEQTKILKRLEDKKSEERQKQNEEVMEPEAVQEAEAPPGEAEAITADLVIIHELEQPSIGDNREEPAEPLMSGSDMPLTALSVDPVNRVAHFGERSDSGIICPVCGKEQMSDKDACFHCSCQFIFDNDEPGRRKHPA